MRAYLKRAAVWLNAGSFWALVLLVLPACGFDSSGLGTAPTQNLDQGAQPWTSMIMCHIEKKNGRHCPVSQDEIDGAIRFSDAAIALAEGRTSPFGLDDTDVGKQNCPGNPGEIVEFEGMFPHGTAVCLNCSQVQSLADALTVCQARCYDFHGRDEGLGEGIVPDVPPTEETKDHCNATTRVAPNGVFLVSGVASCYANLCTANGNTTGVPDPREIPEPVVWTILTGTQPGGVDGNDLTRTAVTTDLWDAGAVSEQWITHGNAYVEFSVADNTKAHFVGLTSVSGCPAPCNADTPDDNSVGFALQLYSDGNYYVVESGAGKFGPNVDNSWGAYSSGQRFRITVLDTGQGTARVLYSRVIGLCNTGTICNVDTFYETTGALPSYPFRVDTSLRQSGATLTDVRLVRLQFQ